MNTIYFTSVQWVTQTVITSYPVTATSITTRYQTYTSSITVTATTVTTLPGKPFLQSHITSLIAITDHYRCHDYPAADYDHPHDCRYHDCLHEHHQPDYNVATHHRGSYHRRHHEIQYTYADDHNLKYGDYHHRSGGDGHANSAVGSNGDRDTYVRLGREAGWQITGGNSSGADGEELEVLLLLSIIIGSALRAGTRNG